MKKKFVALKLKIIFPDYFYPKTWK